MYLDYIEIVDFRPFYDYHKIKFGFNDTQNLTVIMAKNGSGKTSFVNALTWCLYGEELHDEDDRTEPLYNLKKADEIEKDPKKENDIKVSVKIRFYDYEDDNKTKKYFSIYRELLHSKFGETDWTPAIDSYLVVENGEKVYEDEQAKLEIENLIPQDMFQYFFFNGTSLSKYFKNDSDFSLKKSIEEMSQIGLIGEVSERLDGTLIALNKRYNDKKPKHQKDYNKLLEEKIIEKKSLRDEKKANQEKIEIALQNIAFYESKIDGSSSERVNELHSQRKKYEKDLKDVNKSIKKYTEMYESLILELFPLTVLFDELVESLKIADEARVKKTAPPLIEDVVIKDILEDGVCICGTNINENPECIEVLKNRLKNISKVSNETYFNNYNAIKTVLLKLEDLPKIEEYKSEINKNSDRKETLKFQIKSISNELKSPKFKNIKDFEEGLQNNKDEKERLWDENSKIESKIIELDKKINQLKEERDRVEIVSGELEDLNEKIKFCEDAIEVVQDLNINVQKYIRDKVNKKTKQQFTSINWEFNKFIDVKIVKDYQIKIIKTDGREVKGADLSGGEKSLLALSFMMALHSLNGFEIPLIIDAPLEQLDEDKRLDFIEDLHEYTSEKQIVFLFTDTQYTDKVRAKMLKNVFSESELKRLGKYHTGIVNYGNRKGNK